MAGKTPSLREESGCGWKALVNECALHLGRLNRNRSFQNKKSGPTFPPPNVDPLLPLVRRRVQVCRPVKTRGSRFRGTWLGWLRALTPS